MYSESPPQLFKYYIRLFVYAYLYSISLLCFQFLQNSRSKSLMIQKYWKPKRYANKNPDLIFEIFSRSAWNTYHDNDQRCTLRPRLPQCSTTEFHNFTFSRHVHYNVHNIINSTHESDIITPRSVYNVLEMDKERWKKKHKNWIWQDYCPRTFLRMYQLWAIIRLNPPKFWHRHMISLEVY